MDIKKMNVTPLCATTAQSITGGDTLSESVFRAAGYTWQKLKNFGDNIGEFMTDSTYPIM